MTNKQPEALQVPLHELLEAIPEDWRIGVKDNDDWSAGTTWHPVGVMCHQAAAELRRLHEVNAELVTALEKIGLCIAHDNSKGARNIAAAAYAKATGEQQ
jgi:hypothetical protein